MKPHQQLAKTLRAFRDHLSLRNGDRNTCPSSVLEVMSLVIESPEPPGKLASLLGMSPALMTRNVEALIDLGWVQRTPNPKDRRSYIVETTSKGDMTFANLTLPLHRG